MRVPEEFENLVRSHCRFVGAENPLSWDEPLAALGVDSLEIVDLIVEIEDAYGFEFPQELLVPEVFVSARSIWDAVEKMTAGYAGATADVVHEENEHIS